MYNNDYIIGVDENGQPYIAHAYATDGKGSNYRQGIKSGFKAGIGSGLRATGTAMHKYLAKALKNGKMRYAYTKQEVDALYGRTKEKAKTAAKKAWSSKAGRFIDEHDAGISERIMANRLSRKAKKATKKGYHDDAMAYSKRSSELRKESRDERSAAKAAIKRHGKETLSSIKGTRAKATNAIYTAGKKAAKAIDDIGVDDYIRMRKAQKNRPTNRTELEERKAYEEAYKNTWLGKRTTSKRKNK